MKEQEVGEEEKLNRIRPDRKIKKGEEEKGN